MVVVDAGRQAGRLFKKQKKCAAYIPPHSASSTLWAVYKLIMLHIAPPPGSWVFILPTLEGVNLELLPEIEPQVVSTVLAAVQRFNHCAMRRL